MRVKIKQGILKFILVLTVVFMSACGKAADSGTEIEKFDESKAILIEQLPEKMQAAGEIALALSSAECEDFVGKTSLDAEEACRFYFAVWGASEDSRAQDALENAWAEDVEELVNRMLGLTEERDYSVISLNLEEASAPFWFYYKEDGGIGKANATDGMNVIISAYGGNEDEKSTQPYTISVSAAYPSDPEEALAYITTWEFENVDGEIHILSAVKSDS